MKFEITISEKWRSAFRLGTVIIGWLIVIALYTSFVFEAGARSMFHHLSGGF